MLFDDFDISDLIYVRLDTPVDIIKAITEIIIIAYFFYAILNLVRETRAWQLLKGVLLIVFITAIAKIVDLRTLSYLLNNTLGVLAIGAVVVFQPELRRGLEQIGRSTLRVFNIDSKQSTFNTIEAIVRACVEMSRESTGALIVVERQIRLGEIIKTGILLGADVSAELLINIFTKNTPLHDGAVIIRGARIEAATCYLPLTELGDIGKELGTRHRAAIGMTEVSDAIVIVVSEETGYISYIQENILERGIDEDTLRKYLTENLTYSMTADKKILFLRTGKKLKRE